MEKKWVVYFLKSDISNCTYIGATNNFTKRLRQHNGEIGGGAKYTTGNRPWKCVFVISGLPDKISALCLEWRLKRNKKMKSIGGLEKRIYNGFEVLNLEKFTKKCKPTSEIPLITITFNNNFFREEYCLLNDRDNVVIKENLSLVN